MCGFLFVLLILNSKIKPFYLFVIQFVAPLKSVTQGMSVHMLTAAYMVKHCHKVRTGADFIPIIFFKFPLKFSKVHLGCQRPLVTSLKRSQFSGIGILGWVAIAFPAVFTSLGLKRLATHLSQ